MARPKVYARIRRLNGIIIHIPKPPDNASKAKQKEYESAEQITDLHYNDATRRFYTIKGKGKTAKRVWLRYDINQAIQQLRGLLPENGSMCYESLERPIPTAECKNAAG